MADIHAAKNALRAEIQAKVAQMPHEEKIRQSKVVLNKVKKLPVFQNSRRVSIYLSTEGEIDTEELVRHSFEQGKECFIPRYSKKDMQMVKLRSMEDRKNLPYTKWKIKQPLLTEIREDAMENGGLDLIVCPGVAFTKNGDRLGHGGGYYDRYQRTLKAVQRESFTTVAVAFREQILEEIPVSEEDVAVDVVLYAD